MIVAGRDEGSLGAQVAAAAERLGYPLLADPLSGARHGATAIATYDLLLREPDPSFTPEVVVRVGDLPTSKPLRAWLASLDSGIDQIAVDPRGRLAGPRRGRRPRSRTGGAEITRRASLTRRGSPPGDPPTTRSAPRWPARLATSCPSRSWRRGWANGCRRRPILFVAASMPIRDVELYFPARRELPRVLSNRGANGIDGTVSSAFGVAAAGGPEHPVVVLIGDVALAHDIGGLLAARRLGLELTIVLLNNDGGGIFHFLPVSGESDAFEEHVATPHGLDFARWRRSTALPTSGRQTRGRAAGRGGAPRVAAG